MDSTIASSLFWSKQTIWHLSVPETLCALQIGVEFVCIIMTHSPSWDTITKVPIEVIPCFTRQEAANAYNSGLKTRIYVILSETITINMLINESKNIRINTCIQLTPFVAFVIIIPSIKCINTGVCNQNNLHTGYKA